jgi:ectoine hydroxylase-related dioxygenase (phytanoyl-CoA dioxygenase family)
VLARFATGIDRMVGEGYPSDFACVYDGFYQVFSGVSPILTRVLGAGYLMVPEGLSVFHVDTGTSVARSAPHRDSLGPDPSVARGEAPSLINIWIAITDACPPNSCMYVLPAPHDPDFRERPHGRGRDGVDLQGIRALPSAAGSVLGWSTHLLHWGSRRGDEAGRARMSAAVYFQRGDIAPFDKTALSPTAEFGLHDRLAWIAASYSDPELFRFPPSESVSDGE